MFMRLKLTSMRMLAGLETLPPKLQKTDVMRLNFVFESEKHMAKVHINKKMMKFTEHTEGGLWKTSCKRQDSKLGIQVYGFISGNQYDYGKFEVANLTRYNYDVHEIRVQNQFIEILLRAQIVIVDPQMVNSMLIPDISKLAAMKKGQYGHKTFVKELSTVDQEKSGLNPILPTEVGYIPSSEMNNLELVAWMNQYGAYIKVVNIARHSGINFVRRSIGGNAKSIRTYYVESTVYYTRNENIIEQNLEPQQQQQLQPQQQQQPPQQIMPQMVGGGEGGGGFGGGGGGFGRGGGLTQIQPQQQQMLQQQGPPPMQASQIQPQQQQMLQQQGPPMMQHK